MAFGRILCFGGLLLLFVMIFVENLPDGLPRIFA